MPTTIYPGLQRKNKSKAKIIKKFEQNYRKKKIVVPILPYE